MIALLTLLLAGIGARAELRDTLLEKTGIHALTEFSESRAGVDVREVAIRLLSGELSVESLPRAGLLKRLTSALKGGFTGALKALLVPVIASLALRAMLGQAESGAIALLCRTSCVLILMRRFIEAYGVAEAALDALGKLIGIASPVLVSALTIIGATQSAAILTPSAALCAKLVADVLARFALPLCGLAAVVASAANLSDRFRLNRLFALLCRCVTRGVGLILALFVALLGLQGLLAGGQDAAAARVVRNAVRTVLPIVGGEVADASSALAAGALSVRNVAGVAGMLAVLYACAAPAVKLAVCSLSLKLASAVLEPLADAGIVRVIGDYAEVVRLLLAICIGAAMLALLSLGACLAMTG